MIPQACPAEISRLNLGLEVQSIDAALPDPSMPPRCSDPAGFLLPLSSVFATGISVGSGTVQDQVDRSDCRSSSQAMSGPLRAGCGCGKNDDPVCVPTLEVSAIA